METGIGCRPALCPKRSRLCLGGITSRLQRVSADTAWDLEVCPCGSTLNEKTRHRAGGGLLLQKFGMEMLGEDLPYRAAGREKLTVS